MNPEHWTADEGMVFRRKADGELFGTELYLGYTHYIGGVKLDTPKQEYIEDFEEIPLPEEYVTAEMSYEGDS